MVPATGRSTNPVRANETSRASPDLLVKPAGHGRASARDGGHHVGGNKRPATREVHSSLLSANDHRRVETSTAGRRNRGRLHHAVRQLDDPLQHRRGARSNSRPVLSQTTTGVSVGAGPAQGNDTREGIPLQHKHGVILLACSTDWLRVVLVVRDDTILAYYPGY